MVEQRTAELHDAKERVEAILAGVGDGVVVTDLDGNIITTNEAFEQSSGYSAEELIGQSYTQLLLAQDDPGRLEEMQALVESGQVWRGDLVAHNKAGAPYDILSAIAPIRDRTGSIVGYVGSLRDITSQKELERLKDRFIADVSHELRTPITTICLYISLLEVAKPENRAQFLSILKEQSHLLKDLAEEVLDFKKLTLKNGAIDEVGRVNVNALVAEYVKMDLPVAQSAGLKLVFQPGEGLPEIWGDSKQLGRAVNNLLMNAIRYTRIGQVSVRTFREDGAVCVEVQDTGLGIDPEDLPHLFDRFYRGRNVRQTATGGSGLGLAIAKGIVELHGGSISVQSAVGKGSCFCIKLPLREE
jgi:two-component system phosphate regulon sensor histidine kinase PhoR